MTKQGRPCPKLGGDKALQCSLRRDCNSPGLEHQARGSKERSKERRRGRSRAASLEPWVPPPPHPCSPHRSQAWGARCRSSGTLGKVSPKGSPRPPHSFLACRVPFPDCRAAGEETVKPPLPSPTLPKQDGAKFGPWEGTGLRWGWRGRGVRRGLREGGGGVRAHAALSGAQEPGKHRGFVGRRARGAQGSARSHGCGARNRGTEGARPHNWAAGRGW